MIQWIGVALAVVGFLWNSVKDYQNGDIKIPVLQEKTELTKPIYPLQYCLMAYDPNLDRFFYQHENGQWYDFPPQIRKYNNQSQEAMAVANGTQGTSGHYYGQQTQATAYTTRH